MLLIAVQTQVVLPPVLPQFLLLLLLLLFLLLLLLLLLLGLTADLLASSACRKAHLRKGFTSAWADTRASHSAAVTWHQQTQQQDQQQQQLQHSCTARHGVGLV
jgi:hypothetical protein